MAKIIAPQHTEEELARKEEENGLQEFNSLLSSCCERNNVMIFPIMDLRITPFAPPQLLGYDYGVISKRKIKQQQPSTIVAPNGNETKIH